MLGSGNYYLVFDLDLKLTQNHNIELSDWTTIVIETKDLFIEDTNKELLETYEDSEASTVEVISIDNPIESKMTSNLTNSSNELLKGKFMGYGVIRLYRESIAEKEAKDEVEVEGDDTVVSIISVPNYFSPTELLAFLTQEFISNMSHIRLLRSNNPNRFMVLIKFKNSEITKKFKEKFNGCKFNSFENELCHVISIKSILFKPLISNNDNKIPYLLEDPFTMKINSKIIKELPTCPICLERMDSDVTGLMTISCQHTFHSSCLQNWRDNCPVCRYSNLSPNNLLIERSKELKNKNKCSSCNISDNLWICLICGNIGCGRYNSKHAINHYESTNHCFAMDLKTQRVWDYSSDNYVHRLLQNESDGKLVEVSGSSSSTTSEMNSNDKDYDLKKDRNRDYGVEYSNILLTQLESQREYYESRLLELSNNFKSLKTENEELTMRNKKFEEKFIEMEKNINLLNSKTIELQQQKSNNNSAKESKLSKLAKQFEEKYKEEKLISNQLSNKISELESDKKKLNENNLDLQDQINDLMFYVENQKKFENMSENERQNTQIVFKKKKSLSRR